MQFDISATARALQADGAATLETTSYDGRPVWVVSGSKRAAASGLSDDETYSITIDQQTCLPTRVQMLSVDGVLQLDYSLHNVRVDEPLPDTAFTFAPPKGAKVVRNDAGFRRLPLARIGSTPGHVTLLPTWLPAGYVQRWTAVAARSTTANGVTEGRDVVALQYVRGFDALTVTTRTVADPQRRRDDRSRGARHILGRPRPPRRPAHLRRLRRRHRTSRRGAVHHRPSPLRGQGRRLAHGDRGRDGRGADRDRRVAPALPTESR